jgi:hypothetical protein
MSNTQAFLLGMMAAWTPCLVILAWFLRRPISDDRDVLGTASRTPRTTQVSAISSGSEYNGGDPEDEPDHHPEQQVEFHKIARPGV